MSKRNLDDQTVEGFGAEWSRFDQRNADEHELRRLFEGYFRVFPWDSLPRAAEGFDLGCGSGRWARFVAPRVAKLHCIDASAQAIEVAKSNLSGTNIVFHTAGVDAIPLADGSMDFGYSLGVLHHVPDTAAGLAACTAKLKPGAPFLCYLYYRFDNRSTLYRAIWRLSDAGRRVVSRMPARLKFITAEVIAALVYLPLARVERMVEHLGWGVDSLPLSTYRNASYYTMRTDALDRFGTRLERRFTGEEIRAMMVAAGLRDIRFSDQTPYWCAVGYREA